MGTLAALTEIATRGVTGGGFVSAPVNVLDSYD